MSCIFLKKKRGYYNMERPKTTYNHLQPPTTTSKLIQQLPTTTSKHVQPLANNLKPSETRRYGSVYLGVVILRV